jgi:hypothetical protein
MSSMQRASSTMPSSPKTNAGRCYRTHIRSRLLRREKLVSKRLGIELQALAFHRIPDARSSLRTAASLSAVAAAAIV